MLSIILAALYLLIAVLLIGSELYTRVYDTGNSEMAGLASYLFTMPSSLLIDRISENVFGAKIGSSNLVFTVVLGLSAISNAAIIYLVVDLLSRLARR